MFTISVEDAAKELLSRRQSRKSLLPFVEYTYPAWKTGEHHRKICEALEAVERGDCNRLMIFAPPRHSKSELASKRFPAWYLGRHPEHQVITCSYNSELATDFGREVRNIIRDPIFQNVFKEVELSPDVKAAGRWNTNRGGIYVSAGIGGTLTGRGAHLGIIDDPIKNREEADSQRTRDSLWKWYTSTFYTRLMPGGAVVFMCTRWHEDDLAARCLNSEEWVVVELPAMQDNQPLWPEWFSRKELEHTKSVIPARDWLALYQQRPTADKGTYIKREWFKRYKELPESLNIYMASDFAVTPESEGAGADWTEHGVFGVDHTRSIHVIDWWSGRTTPDAWVEALLRLAKTHKPLAWFGESGVIRRSVESLLVRQQQVQKVFFRKEWIAPLHDKAVRGRAFQGIASMGKVYFPETVWAEEVIDQCVGFPGAKHDDKFDTMALMCLAVDKAHPAIIQHAPRPRGATNWRVA